MDTVEDQLKEMEKKDTNVKEASNREKEDQLILERLGNQLKYNMKKLEEAGGGADHTGQGVAGRKGG